MGNVEIPNWLKALPLAPEFRPTETEFADPIAYISKIEKEAGAFGICKVIPPFPRPSKKYVFGNLNKSLSKSPELGPTDRGSSPKVGGSADDDGDGEVRAVFTTRQQELGQSVKKSKGSVQNSSSGVHKHVWQSGQVYTLEQFETKSRVFAKAQLGAGKEVSPLVIEALFWKAASEKPLYLEYANDVPGSGFGEPEGQCRYFHKRRRKRNFFMRSREADSGGVDVSSNDDNKGVCIPRNESTTSLGTSESLISQPTLVSDEATQSSKKKSQSSCYDKEGSAGWKISNCPWNLQVISRSPGSLTRFMPDDIPGVTSPMVYIGMLYSWFAWHVEDHELHSMNFLHTGSAKTWYSIPGDYAFLFEDVVRTEAYGANIDRIAALARLGEKTTLMSPEVVIASGIPCCRLVQNPGEFVVTFPRAYHIGFSHGFNCGEAANFGTPQWLNVAKEAAVRRAAMNYLPMLSHQQLLYLLTMSFVSRVPRSLLPGVRSSRLRDRQKEERELLVKKEFIKDILHDNSVLSSILVKNSSYQAVLWNQDLLTQPSKETVSVGDNADNSSFEKVSHAGANNKHSNEHNHLLEEMSFYMENLNDLYFGSDDLSCDFQVDSGTLACVACGILGFPFMSVVQPSEKASLELVQECPGMSGYLKQCSSPNHDATNNEGPSTVLDPLSVVNFPQSSTIKSKNGWNVHNKILRPRSFCLEHAVETVELLECKGGANVLVICHSDYQKIKAHATTIAEEIDIPFNYHEVELDLASREDLNLIDLAIEDGQHKESGEDWTSKLGINLRHCVKNGKNSASKQVRDALTLGGLLSSTCPGSDTSTMKWKLRRSRSRKLYYPPLNFKPRDTTESKNHITVERESLVVDKEVKQLIQYTRRNLKSKRGESEQSKIGESLKVSVGSIEMHATEEMNADSEARCLVTLADSEMPTQLNAVTQEVGVCNNSSVHCAEESSQTHEENNGEVCNLATEGHFKEPGDENVLASSCFHVQISDTVIDSVCVGDQVCDLVPGNKVEIPDSCTTVAKDHTGAPMEEFSEGPKLSSSAEDLICGKSLEIIPPEESGDGLIGVGNSEELALSTVTQMEVDNPCVSEQEYSIQRGNLPQENRLDDAISGNCSPKASTKTGNEPMPIEAEESAKEHSGDDLTFDDKFETTPVQIEEETASKTAITFQKYSRIKRESENNQSNAVEKSSNGGKRKRNRELERLTENKLICNGFIRSPCEGLRPRAGKDVTIGITIEQEVEEKPETKRKKSTNARAPSKGNKKEKRLKAHKCDIESCKMSFDTKAELSLHKRNRCPHSGCGKRFSSHKYAMIHHRVHEDDRPLKCPWRGCFMSFKWAWARTEHIRVHTGEKPYKCKIEGCGLAFRFVSDYSRHRRKTGHYVN